MPIKIIQPPTAEPVSLEEAKLHFRVDGDADDALILSLLAAARDSAELKTGRQLMPATLRYLLDCFPGKDGWPGGAGILIPKAPVQSILSIQYADQSGQLQQISGTNYRLVGGDLPKIVPVPGFFWPSTEPRNYEAVTIEFVAGYADESQVPPTIKTWILMRAASMYAQREGDAKNALNQVSFLDSLLDSHRVPAW
ncbi:MAG: head-tail connector protein [Magnetococcus sp. YQC-5]